MRTTTACYNALRAWQMAQVSSSAVAAYCLALHRRGMFVRLEELPPLAFVFGACDKGGSGMRVAFELPPREQRRTSSEVRAMARVPNTFLLACRHASRERALGACCAQRVSPISRRHRAVRSAIAFATRHGLRTYASVPSAIHHRVMPPHGAACKCLAKSCCSMLPNMCCPTLQRVR